jgi:cytochrome b subunit of formate dehydrogenase
MKFNYASAMMLMSTYPIFIVTGVLIWITDSAFLFWLIHLALALMATLFLLSHILMSVLDPPARVALSKRISGFVDRRYQKHDHKR